MSYSFLTAIASQPTAGALAWLLPLVRITGLLLTALAITVTMRRAPAGARHLVWLVALTSLLVLPFLAAWAPLAVPVLPATPIPGVATAARAQVSFEAPIPEAPSRVPAKASQSAPPRRGPIGVGSLLIGVWFLGAVALLARLVLSAWAIRRLVRGARVLEQTDWNQPLFEIADRLGLDRAPELLQSDRAKLPFACGFLRARIVLPPDSEGWSRARRSTVLIHELGHVRRGDLIGHTLSRIVCALYWFHPLVWSAARRLRVESERACDDLALVLGARPSEYAEHLLDIVSQVRGSGAPAVALAMANPNEFEGRLLAILNPRIPRRGLGRVQVIGLVGSLAALAFVFGAVSPAPKAAAKPNGSMPSEPGSPAIVARDESRSSDTARHDVRAEAKTKTTDEETPDGMTESATEDTSDVTREEASSKSEEGIDNHRVEVLAKTLRTDASPEVRRVAAWGLARYARMDGATRALTQALVSDEDEDVREMAAWALSDSRGNPSVVTALYAAFRRDKSTQVRRTAAWAAGSIGDRSLVPGLVELLADRDPNLREVAAWSIGSCGSERAPAALVRLLSDPEPNVRLSVAWALREIEDPDAADALESAFRREEDPEVRLGIIRALGSMGDRAIETLSRLVESPDPRVRTIAVTALAGGNATGPWPWPRPEPRPFP